MLNKKIIFFCLLAYFFQLIIENLAISSNSFFINIIGAEQLPKALIISSLLTPVFIFILSILEKNKNSRQIKILFLLIISSVILFLMYSNSGVEKYKYQSVWIYQIFSNLFSLISIILYWNLINNYFYVFESKLFFSYFIISEEIGAISSDILINKVFYRFTIAQYYIVNFVSFILLLLLYLYVFRIKKINGDIVENNEKDLPEKSSNSILKNKYLFNLLLLYIVVLCLFHFISSIVNYQFNYIAGVKLTNTEDLNKFFSEFQLISSIFIIITSFALNRFFFSKSKIIFQHLIYAFSLLVLVYFMNIMYTFYVIVVVEMIKSILEHSLFQTSYEHFTATFSEKVSDKIRNLSEGFFIPIIIVFSGIFMTFFPSKFDFHHLNISLLLIILLVAFFVVLIKDYYYKYHLNIIKNNLNIENVRSVQALGEKNNYDSLPYLMERFEKSEDRFLKKNIVLSIGKINSSQSIDYIFSILNDGDEFIQSAAADALFLYRSYKVEYLLVEFIQGEKNRSLYIRHKMISFINKLYTNAIIPFFMHFLYSDDYRVVANAIENFWDVKDKKLVPFMLKFLSHPSNRVRANSIILIYSFKIKYYNEFCIKTLISLKNSKELNDKLSFVFVVGFLKMEKYSNDVADIYEALKNESIFKERLVENFAFSLAALNNPIGDDLFQFLFLELTKYPQTLLYKFKLLPLSIRLKVIKSFFDGGFGTERFENLYENFKNSVYDLSFEVEVIEELIQKNKS